jgi:triacylglycerol lipase
MLPLVFRSSNETLQLPFALLQYYRCTTPNPNCKELLITGHSLGGALSALAAPDLLNDVAANLAPIVYTWAEPRVGHPDYVRFFDARVNICYRIVNIWDVVPQIPPVLALYEHEGSSLHIDSGFTLDIVL